MGMTTVFRCAAMATALGTLAPAAHALTWNVTYGSGLAAGTPERKAFDAGLAFWASKMSDNVTVPFTANFGTTTDTSLLGGTSATYYSGSGLPTLTYASLRTYMTIDAADESDDAITASLPSTFAAMVNTGRTLSTRVDLTRTNARALGIIANGNTGSDGDILFYNKGYYDFDNSNGVTAGKLDFYSTVVHELGHLMGFVSAVDDSYDDAYGNAIVYANPLDLYRFSGNSGGPTTAALFGSTARDLRYGVASHFDDTVSKFAMDNAISQQASHWLEAEDNGPAYVGVMDPVQSAGVVDAVTYADYRAFDLIGWDLNAAAAVPEPTTLAALAGVAIVARRRRSR